MKKLYVFLLATQIIMNCCNGKNATIPAIDRLRKKVTKVLQDPNAITLTSNQHALLHNHAYDQDGDIREAESLLTQLFWSNQHDLATLLCNSVINNTDKKAALIQAITSNHQSIRPLIEYAHALSSEEQLLSKAFTLLLKAANSPQKDRNEKIQELLEKHTQTLTTLTALITSSNTLLMNT